MSIQVEILNSIKSSRKDTNSFVQELSALLSISPDSSYRRLRGDTEVTLDELAKICQHYGLSVDSFFNRKSQHVSFLDQGWSCNEFSYTAYLKSLKQDIDLIRDFGEVQIFYSAKDIPFFYNFLIDEISAFKGFYWEKSVVQLPELRRKKFSVKGLSSEHQDLGHEILDGFNSAKSSELWNDEVLTSTMKQIKFYYESDYFESPEDVEVLIEKVDHMIDHFEQQADLGLKYRLGETPGQSSNQFLLYYSDIFMGDNTVMVDMGGRKGVFKSHNIVDKLSCMDEQFCARSWEMHEKFLNSAILISEVSQRERTKFFNRLRKKVEILKRDVLQEA